MITLLPMGGLSYFVYTFTNHNTEKEINSLNLQSLNKTRDSLDTIFREIDRLAVQLCFDESVQNFLLASRKEWISNYNYEIVFRSAQMFTLIYDYIDSIYIYSDKNHQLVTTKWRGDISNFADKLWFSDYQQKKDTGVERWFSSRKLKTEDSNYPYLISLFRPAKVYPPDSIGLVVINIDVLKLIRLMGNIDRETSRDIFILDNDGTIFYNGDAKLISKNIKSLKFYTEDILKKDKFSEIIDMDGRQMSLTVSNSDVYGWKYMSLVPLEYYNEKNKGLFEFIFTFIIFSILAAVIISFLISLRVYTPIKNIISAINNQNKSSDETLKHKRDKENETYFIINSIINSIDSNKMLEEKLANNLLRLDKAHTLALQSQINPHFMHNTLETIRMMVIQSTGNLQDPASNMLESLAQMLRISMETKEYLIPIETEIMHCKQYIEIIKLRYSDKISVTWKIDDTILPFRIVKLSLQPLIENAVYHGIKPKQQKGDIIVRGYTYENDIVIEVEDNGIGMTEETLKVLNQLLQDKYNIMDDHVGLINVNQRIKLIFGDRYGIFIDSTVGSGTKVKIIFPAVGHAYS